jgi:hypothetical protein
VTSRGGFALSGFEQQIGNKLLLWVVYRLLILCSPDDKLLIEIRLIVFAECTAIIFRENGRTETVLVEWS